MIRRPALFVCDMQEKFTTAIHGFSHVSATTSKLLKFAQLLDFPIYYTTQLRSKLGVTVPALQLPADTRNVAIDTDKSMFSMCVPEILDHLAPESSVALVGIESHICVTQTALDLMARGHAVYVMADGVSSCNKEEVPIALRRLAREGATVTTSEGFMYQLVRDAGVESFKAFATLVKETKEETKAALRALPGSLI